MFSQGVPDFAGKLRNDAQQNKNDHMQELQGKFKSKVRRTEAVQVCLSLVIGNAG